jgi:uncharacterized membrane protein YfhO
MILFTILTVSTAAGIYLFVHLLLAGLFTYALCRTLRINVAGSAVAYEFISEAYYPAWRAYIDGRPVPLYVADHVLRAVPVPAGEHTVELRYESSSLRIGLAISVISYLALIALAVAGTQRRRKSADKS